MALVSSADLTLFADFFQFYLQDESVDEDWSDSWNDDATSRMLAVAPGVVAIGTVRAMNVPVRLEVHDEEPGSDFGSWDHVVECGLSIESGRIVVAGCSEYFPDAARLEVRAGSYSVRASYGGLKGISDDGLGGHDRYRVQLWPGPITSPHVLKRMSNDLFCGFFDADMHQLFDVKPAFVLGLDCLLTCMDSDVDTAEMVANDLSGQAFETLGRFAVVKGEFLLEHRRILLTGFDEVFTFKPGSWRGLSDSLWSQHFTSDRTEFRGLIPAALREILTKSQALGYASDGCGLNVATADATMFRELLKELQS
jgi:hypothetical protein